MSYITHMSYRERLLSGKNVMENALIVPEQPALPAALTATLAADFAKASKAKPLRRRMRAISDL
jgi:hypothetical protein